MIYAIRHQEGRETLMEFDSIDAILAMDGVPPGPVTVSRVDEDTARKWLLDGKEHETGLWIDEDGFVHFERKQSSPTYAIRTSGMRETLVELDDERMLSAVPPALRRVPTYVAHQWVRNGREHETGLFINDDGNVAYAEGED